jgi:hypothetical protein
LAPYFGDYDCMDLRVLLIKKRMFSLPDTPSSFCLSLS